MKRSDTHRYHRIVTQVRESDRIRSRVNANVKTLYASAWIIPPPPRLSSTLLSLDPPDRGDCTPSPRIPRAQTKVATSPPGALKLTTRSMSDPSPRPRLLPPPARETNPQHLDATESSSPVEANREQLCRGYATRVDDFFPDGETSHENSPVP